jgi:hypothetical protein
MRTILALSALMLAIAQAQATCRSEVGDRQSRLLVRQCLDVSPATHPPCNAGNSCDLIISEIKRGCGLLARGEAPTYCARYRQAN